MHSINALCHKCTIDKVINLSYKAVLISCLINKIPNILFSYLHHMADFDFNNSTFIATQNFSLNNSVNLFFILLLPTV